MRTTGSTVRLAAATVAFASTFALAGGPLGVCSDGNPIRYTTPTAAAPTVALNYDGGGTLGARSKAQADAIVTSAVSFWTNVSTTTILLTRGPDLPRNVT